ncbi:MAG: TonB-dependent receptor [Luteitalea sp.]|nr:TonB-dependent receptor [Luteitalea sp.]
MLLAFVVALSMMQAGGADMLSGIVRDTSGGAVSGATVILQTSDGVEQQTVTGPDGRFAFDNVADGTTLIVRAGGFAAREQPITGASEIEVVLSPASLLETLTVTPTRSEQRLGSTPASVNVLDRDELRASAAIVADDVLRQLPTFSLFRRTSSLSSHPTAQGVSLRGIGPSGVSRTLVLIDNVPFNDPFGGWVYWTRVPIDSVERIEVVDGPSSSLYGNYAMGGVINVMSSRAAARTVELKAQYGNRSSPKLDFFGSDVRGNLGVVVDGSLFDTDGFPSVVAAERGAVDTNARVDFKNVNVKVDYRPTDRMSAFARAGYFREERNNGKVSTFTGDPEANDTTWTSLNGGVRLALPGESDLQVRLFADFETFHSTFLAVPDLTTRSIGRMALDQEVPSKGIGGMAQWSKAVGGLHYVTAGTDWRWVDGDSEESVLDFETGTSVVTERVAGGTQRSVGVFVQDIFTPRPNLNVTLGARVDHWRNYDGHHLETSVATGQPTEQHRPLLPTRSDTVVSPRGALSYRFTDRISAWGAINWGFRAPTLNELYRQFRVGATLTRANEDLGPERLLGGEAGVNVAASRNMTVRATWYDNRVKNPVSNVTVATNVRQRQNLGRTRIRGLQTDVEYRLGSTWRLSGGYLFNHATVREFDASPVLVGNFLPQVPKHRGAMHVVYSDPRLVTLGFGVQVIGRQFDDDQNIRVVPGEGAPGLPGYAVVDVTASRDVGRGLQVFVGAQNLLGQEYFVGTNPTTIGSPRLVHIGVRARFAGR